MSTPTTKDQVLQLYERYKTGQATKDLAASAGITRQAMAQRFQQYGLKMREKHHQPFRLFNNKKYSLMVGKSYYRSTTRPFELLQRAIWEHAHGPIPDGTEIYFKNGDQSDVSLNNLVAIANRRSKCNS